MVEIVRVERIAVGYWCDGCSRFRTARAAAGASLGRVMTVMMDVGLPESRAVPIISFRRRLANRSPIR